MSRGGGGGSGIGSSLGGGSTPPTAHEIRGKRNPAQGPGVTWDPRRPRKPGRSGGRGSQMGYQTMLSRQALMILMK